MFSLDAHEHGRRNADLHCGLVFGGRKKQASRRVKYNKLGHLTSLRISDRR